MRMHIKKGSNFGRMIAVVKDCEGEVFLKSDQGDILNLKSTLSQYVFVSMGVDADIWDWVIECSVPGDYEVLAPFLTQGPD